MDFGLTSIAQPQEREARNSLSADKGPAAEASRLEFACGKGEFAGCEDGVAVWAGFEIDCGVHREPPVVTLGLARKKACKPTIHEEAGWSPPNAYGVS
jgi:hypothetical protein